jgi:hypothetical protein
MKRIILAVSAIAVLAVPATSLANAGNGRVVQGGGSAGVPEVGYVGSAQGNSQQYSATYTDPVFGGPITCTGAHQFKQHQDSFTCTLNAGSVWSNTPSVGQTVSWNSDWEGVANPGATLNGSMTIKSVGLDATGNVTSYTGVATYTS